MAPFQLSNQSIVLQIVSVLFLLQFLRWFCNRLTRHSVSYLPGPQKSDWLFGNLTDLHFNEVGVVQFAWQNKYGHALKMHGLFGELYLMISDPKAIQYIYANSNTFLRQNNSRELFQMILGPGLITATGDSHKRQRRVIQPAFGMAQLKALFPVFSRHVEKLAFMIKKDIEGGIGRGNATIDVHRYATGAALDIIGDAAFDHQFGALDNKQDDLREILDDLALSFVTWTKREVLLQYGLEWLPSGFIFCLSRLPITKFSHLVANGRRLEKMADQIVQEKTDAYAKGLEGGKDLMSLLVRANANEKPSVRLSDHGTTANTLSFALWELAKDVDLQCRLRQETTETLHRVQGNGKTEIRFDEYESMHLLVAFMKEVFRFHPVGFVGGRQVMEDSVIPLSSPVMLESGKSVNEIPVSKGQQIWVNIPGYNRLPEIFGEDAYEFNVDRWIRNGSKPIVEHGVGVYSNLITFAHGPRACIGWRFALLELQMLLIELISSFEFTLPANGKNVCRSSFPLMSPTVEGEPGAGTVLFLDVSIIGS